MLGDCYWCDAKVAHNHNCLQLTNSKQMDTNDPAYWMLSSGQTSKPVVYRDSCYICRDPEFAQMGLPLCRPCNFCTAGHVAADDEVCDDCGNVDGPRPEDYETTPEWTI